MGVSLLRGLTAVELYSIDGLYGKFFHDSVCFKKVSQPPHMRYKLLPQVDAQKHVIKQIPVVAFILVDWHSICYFICNVEMQWIDGKISSAS